MFGIVDDILVVGYDDDGRDHDETVWNVLQRCSEVNLKLNKDKCNFSCTSISFFREVILRYGVQPDPQKSWPLWTCHHLIIRELQAFLGIINYLGKFSPSMMAVCDPFQKLT